jgi:hypothetical protein
MLRNIFTEITIYPNPNGGILNIASTGVTKLTIYNILGNKVFQMHLNPERELNTVKLNQLTPGLYLIKVENFNNEIFTSKIYFQN